MNIESSAYLTMFYAPGLVNKDVTEGSGAQRRMLEFLKFRNYKVSFVKNFGEILSVFWAKNVM